MKKSARKADKLIRNDEKIPEWVTGFGSPTQTIFSNIILTLISISLITRLLNLM